METDTNKTPTPRTSAQTLLFGLIIVKRDRRGRPLLRPHWRNLLIAFVALGSFLWLSKTVALFFAYRELRDYRDVSLAQTFLYPFNRAEMTRKFGDWQVAEGKKALEERDARAAYLYLRAGVARSPANREGRLTLAMFEQANGDGRGALATLRGGMDYFPDDEEYLQLYLRLLMDRRQDAELLEYAGERLAEGPQPLSRPKQIVAFAAARVKAMHGNYSDAEQMLKDYELLGSQDAYALWASLLWNAGKREQAVQRLRRSLAETPASPLLNTLLSQYLRDMGRPEEALLPALTLVNVQPQSYSARIEMLRSYAAAKREDRVQTEVANYLRDFGKQERALLDLANWAADQGNTAASQKTYRRAAEKGYNMAVFGLLHIETYLTDRRFAQAEEFCQQLQDEGPAWLARFPGQFNFLRAVAAIGQGNTDRAQLYMGRVIEERLTADELLSMAHRLRSVGMDEQARTLFERAHAVDPDNELAVAGLVEIDIDQGTDRAFVANVDKLMQLRRPDHELLVATRERLLSDRFIFAPRRSEVLQELDEALAPQI